METKVTEQKTEMTVILNDDCKALDFLCDLKDRQPLHGLQRFIKEVGDKPIALLYYGLTDDLVVLIIYLPPFKWGDTENKLAIYAHKDLLVLAWFFQDWRNRNRYSIAYDEEIDDALAEIVSLLYGQWTEGKDKETLSDYQG